MKHLVSLIGKTNLLIHSFALAHALVTVLFRYQNLPDEIPLTILTVLLVVLVARLYDVPLDISSALALLFCFAGFFMGTKGAELLQTLPAGWWQHYSNVITTVLVTEILGWSTYFVAHRRIGK